MEKQVHVHDFSFHLKLTQGQLQTFLALIFVCAFASGLSPESVTLSTYYPAPAGVYNNMVTIGNTWLARDPVPATGQPSFVELGSNAAVNPGTKLAVMNGNVGIGTTSPATTLDVNGWIRAGAATTGGFCATQGALGYDYSAKAPVYCGPAVGINGYPHWTSYSGGLVCEAPKTCNSGTWYWFTTGWGGCSVSCDPGYTAVGGGFVSAMYDSNGQTYTDRVASYPLDQSTWYCYNTGFAWGSISCYVQCCK